MLTRPRHDNPREPLFDRIISAVEALPTQAGHPVHPVDELMSEADAAIERMKASALAARHLHARAELMRHMRLAAAKVAGRPLDDAVCIVVGEWMSAWGLDRSAYPALTQHIAALTRAFCRDAAAPTAETRTEIRTAWAGLETGFETLGTTLGDEMAFRSESGHAWWASVVPRPVGQC